MEPLGGLGGEDSAFWLPAELAWDGEAMLGASMAWLEGVGALLPPPPGASIVADEAPEGAAAAAAPKARGGASTGRRRGEARCQADGCLEVLRAEDTPRYRLRYRLCALHLRAEVALVKGVPSRFCQKCSRFQPLSEFTGTRRTCSAALAKQRNARPSQAAVAAAAAAAAAGPSSGGGVATPPDAGGRPSRASPSGSKARGGGPSSGTGSPPSRTPSREATAAADGTGLTLQALLAPFLRIVAARSYDASLASGTAASYDDVAALDALVTSEACQLAALHAAHLKLPRAAPPALPDAFSAQLQAAWLQGAVAAGGLAALEAAVRPGCSVLHVDAMLMPGAPPPESAIAAANALAADVAIGAFFAAGAAGAGATLATAGRVAPVGGAGRERRVAAPARLPPLRPAAVLAAAGGQLRFAKAPRGLPAAAVLRARLAGRMLSAPGGEAADPSAFPAPRGRGAADAITLPPLPRGVEGALLLDAFASAAAEFPLNAAPRAVLVCADAAIVAEVNAAADAADAAAASDGGAAQEALEAVLPALGRALRPGGDASLLSGVAAEALRRGWTATSSRLLASLAAALAEEGEAFGIAAAAPPDGAATPLHAAALHGSAAAVAAALRCGGAAGVAAASGPRGVTPLHLAASRRDAAASAVVAALRAAPGAAAAWDAARDAWGLSPADVAARQPSPPPPTEREFVAWLSRANRSSVMAIAALQLLHFPTWVGYRHVLSASAAPDAETALRAMHFLPRVLVRSSTLYDVATGAVVPLQAVPWPAVVAGTRTMVRLSLAARLPANAVLLLSAAAASPSRPRAQRWFASHFEAIYAVCNAIEMLHMPLVEYLACYRALGLAVDYSPIFGLSYALATLLLSPGFGRSGTFGPCRAACNYGVLLLRLVAFAGALTWQRMTWGAALRSPQLLAQMAMCLLSLANVAPNERRLRRLCAAERAAAAKRVD